MKKILYALSLSVLLFSCQQKEKAFTYTPRILTVNEKFNDSLEGKDSLFTIYKYNGRNKANAISGTEEFGIKFRDTVVSIKTIQAGKSDTGSVTDKFVFAQFINTQQTTLLVQLADQANLSTAFYLLSLKSGKLEVISLYRPSTGKEDTKFTTGIIKIGRGGYIINNDFFVTNVNAQVYLVKRQSQEERIQGEFLLNSPDKSTLVFLLPSSLYQVNYISDEVLTLPLSKPAPQSADVQDWVRNNFSWEKNKKGISFLKHSDNDRIVDIKEFK